MTFLELCQRLRQEVGAAGSGPANVSGQAGEMARLVNWVHQAWHEIQMEQRWRFNWSTGEVELSTSDTIYPLPADFDDWVDATLSAGGDRVHVYAWDDFRKIGNDCLRAASIAPDDTLRINAPPKQSVSLAFEYWRTPQSLDGNNDVPRMPERYHMVIVYAAMVQYGLYENAPEVVQQGRANYSRIMQRVARTELPGIDLGESLA